MVDKTLHKLLDRPADSHKYTYGHVMVVGGSPGMVGAPLMSAMAAFRVGAGLVTIGSSPGVIDKLERRVVEVMTLRIASPAELTAYIKDKKVNSIVFGPGLETSYQDLLEALLKTPLSSLVIDGGGLGILKSNLGLLAESSVEQLILTPHYGEFQRFFSKDLPTSIAELGQVGREFAELYGLTLVLKGHPTLVLDSKSEAYKNTTGGPELATAGTGDVLSGMIAGICAQGIKAFDAACLGVELHALAGKIAAQEKTGLSVIASDVIASIPTAIKRLSRA